MQPEQPLKILVTGADGFLGLNLLIELLNRGYTVNALVEESRGNRIADFQKVSIYYGNLLKPDTIEAASKDCDAIIHTAACTDMWPSRSEKIRAINYQGTKNIIDIALKQNIKRLVHVGTANSFGFGSNGTIGMKPPLTPQQSISSTTSTPNTRLSKWFWMQSKPKTFQQSSLIPRSCLAHTIQSQGLGQ